MSWGETIYLKQQFEKVQKAIEGQIPVVATASENDENSPNGVDIDTLSKGNTWFIIEGDKGE